jgi:hypothetical protein
MAPCAQEPRRLGDGGALTVLRFVPVRGCVRDWVFPLKKACEPGLCKEGTNCRTRDNEVEEGDFKKANFFIFRPIEVPKEPRQGFWDARKPLEQSVCHFEHCKACF